MTPKASKSNDQRFNWLKCRNAQRQFKYLWQKASSTVPTTPANTTQHGTIRMFENFYVFDSNQLPEQ